MSFSRTEDAQGLAIEIRYHWPALKKINLFIISNCSLSHRVKSVAGTDVSGVDLIQCMGFDPDSCTRAVCS